MQQVPPELRYTKTHEWVCFSQDGKARVGITDYAQKSLGDIVFVNFPQIGEDLAEGDMLGDLESVKTVEEIYTPVGGEVSAVNRALAQAPEAVNRDPYGSWLVEISHATPGHTLMDSTAYEAYCNELED